MQRARLVAELGARATVAGDGMSDAPPPMRRGRQGAPAAKPRLTSAYWRLWTASTVSNLGDGVDIAALPLLAATLTRDPRLVAGMGVAFTLPWLLFALPAGAIVDRLDRRRVMYRVNLVRTALVAVIALSVATGSASIWMLYAIALAMGFCETLFDNAAQAMLPAIVEPSLLEVANGRQYAAEIVANTFAGPPLGGVLFAVAASVPFWIDSGSFLISALLIATLAGSFRPAPAPGTALGADGSPARRSLRHEIAEGVRWLQGHRLLRTLALLLGALNFANWLGMSTAVLFAQEILGLDDRGFGLLLAGMAVGGVLGGIFGARIAAALGPGPALVVSIAAIGFSEAAVGLMSNALAVAGLFWISGLFVPVWNIITVSLRQQIVPDHLLGRVNSVYRFLGWGSQPLGALIGGLLANAYGLRVPWWVGADLTAVCLVLAVPRITTNAIEAAKAAAPERACLTGGPRRTRRVLRSLRLAPTHCVRQSVLLEIAAALRRHTSLAGHAAHAGAAVDHVGLAGDPARGVAGQERGQAGDVVRLAEASQRQAFRQHVAVVVDEHLGEVGLHEARQRCRRRGSGPSRPPAGGSGG